MAKRARSKIGQFAAIGGFDGSLKSLAKRAPNEAVQPLALASDSRIVAVWGPVGSTGKSTIAASLASALAASGPMGKKLEPTVALVDLDVFGPSQATLHALPEVTAGVLGSARLLRQERYTDQEHERLTVHREGYDLLTGITALERWTELDEYSVKLLLHELAGRYESVVVDVSGRLDSHEVDPESGMHRHQAAQTVLTMADLILCVASADPISLARLPKTLHLVKSSCPGRLWVVINRMRDSAIGPNAQKQLVEFLNSTGVAIDGMVFVDDDSAACDLALLQGLSVAEVRPRSGFAKAVRAISSQINSNHVYSARIGEAERQG